MATTSSLFSFGQLLPSLIHVHVCMLSCFSRVQLFETLRTIAHQAPLSMGFSRQEYWSGLQCPPPEDLLNPGFEPMSVMSPALAGEFFTTNTSWEAPSSCTSPHHSLSSNKIYTHQPCSWAWRRHSTSWQSGISPAADKSDKALGCLNL